jgi:hypothetical protein
MQFNKDKEKVKVKARHRVLNTRKTLLQSKTKLLRLADQMPRVPGSSHG